MKKRFLLPQLYTEGNALVGKWLSQDQTTEKELRVKSLDTNVNIFYHKHPTWSPETWDLNVQN